MTTINIRFEEPVYKNLLKLKGETGLSINKLVNIGLKSKTKEMLKSRTVSVTKQQNIESQHSETVKHMGQHFGGVK